MYERSDEKEARLKRERSQIHNTMIGFAELLKDGESLHAFHSDWGHDGLHSFVFCSPGTQGEVRLDIRRTRVGVHPFLQVEPSGYSRRWERRRLSLKKALDNPADLVKMVRELAGQKDEREVAEDLARKANKARIDEATKMLGFKTDEYHFMSDRGDSPFDRITSSRRADGALEFIVSLANPRLTATGVKRLEALLREEVTQLRSSIVPGAISQRPNSDCTCFECAFCHAPTVCAACLMCATCTTHIAGCAGCPGTKPEPGQ